MPRIRLTVNARITRITTFVRTSFSLLVVFGAVDTFSLQSGEIAYEPKEEERERKRERAHKNGPCSAINARDYYLPIKRKGWEGKKEAKKKKKKKVKAEKNGCTDRGRWLPTAAAQPLFFLSVIRYRR